VSRVRIIIVEDEANGINMERTNLLVATMRKDPNLIWQSKISKSIPRKSSNTTIDAGRKISSSKEGLKIYYYR
jgi:hypothetical protein